MSLTLYVYDEVGDRETFRLYMRGPHLGDVRAQPHRGQLARPRDKLTDVAQWWLFIFEIKLNWPITCRSISPGDQASLLVNLRSIGPVAHTHTGYYATGCA